MRLAQRLLDPAPAGNRKLQTLRLRLRLPERSAHMALGDVGTVSDLFATVLRPIAEQRGLETWEQLAADAAEEWVASRIAFGQHKGRSIAEARTDAGLRRWLDGLAQSSNARNARMGRWSLRSLEEGAEPSLFVAWECPSCPSSSLGTRLAAKLGFVGVDDSAGVIPRETLGKQSFQDKGVTKQELGHEGSHDEGSRTVLVLYVNPELQRLRALVDAARARLAELEAGFTIEKAQVEAMKARLFARLREHFQRRDRLRLVIGYRRKYLESLVRQGEEEAGKIAQEYRQASAQSDREYAETAAALAEKQELTAEETAEVSQLWRKLVKLFHPDRFAHERGGHRAVDAESLGTDGAVPSIAQSRKTRTASSCGKAGRRSTSARSARSRNCAACGLALSWKSSACWRRVTRSRRAPVTSCTG